MRTVATDCGSGRMAHTSISLIGAKQSDRTAWATLSPSRLRSAVGILSEKARMDRRQLMVVPTYPG